MHILASGRISQSAICERVAQIFDERLHGDGLWCGRYSDVVRKGLERVGGE